MKSVIIASESSGSGKTTATIGLMAALVKKGLKVQGYKVGPDYIDTAFHEKVTGKASRNLDIFLMGEHGIKASYMRGNGDVGIIEGVMGLYDGKGIDSKYSTAHVSKVLGIPVVLVMSSKGRSATICAEINGMIDFGNINIVGVIFNNISESYYKLLKASVEKNCNVEVFGYIPKDNRISLESRHLGLVQSSEVEDLNSKIDILSDMVLENINVDRMMKYFKEANYAKDEFHIENKNLKIAVAFDKAFSFYYKENLEILKEAGEVVFFSPLHDKKLPEDIDFLYIGGGYPEIFIKELSENKSMLSDIKNKLNLGLRCYAECGGLMYLMDTVEDFSGGGNFNSVGFFTGSVHMTKKLQNFGYANIKVSKENNVLKQGLSINCHEFHKSYIESDENRIYEVTKEMYNGKTKMWKCGYTKKNTLASYAHVHFFGNLDFIKDMLDFK
ncbi:cobyrinate a,c-diamide synthase [Clostridium sp. cel8]|uniref:cobyrinate a,c-diamide synthase n=1 Tax=Clostridium sp. cel8 TaxID=2663123 RepID=UPI0015F6EF9E|nr:cobyrinate a,c-diamide synthase [Clostridium sp. cel8]MBA5850974.1 cobyrinate a,c-diamide synthase [Clostridium sp. cel8]